MLKYFIVTLPFVACLSGCATMTQGMNEGVRVESIPAGATAVTNIRASGRHSIDGWLGCRPTPCSISIPRKKEPIITVSLGDYQPIKFKVTSTVATGSSAVPSGSLVAGLPPGTHVYAGKADLLKRIPSGSRVMTGAVFSLGTGAVLDLATGANKNLAPNPVTVVFAPENSAQATEVPRAG